ncbi:leucoanthocyanidin dioxygenase-like [Gossypium australe]|uniref:Leucoanthocyanidin dioxygenase-like n=1 Tax=Gossypium australe TaxID=47621 RepID=A0A5B6USI5_9ROSI|nr:leucoanthocyanidin dioxygenase-like [Gossypium australe]
MDTTTNTKFTPYGRQAPFEIKEIQSLTSKEPKPNLETKREFPILSPQPSPNVLATGGNSSENIDKEAYGQVSYVSGKGLPGVGDSDAPAAALL